ncbi:putative signal peptide protein [Puccinia sorghi]|uniref:Putative signal peptide protein n=1 Tax=Puccinia sorghi TaxID=27349 RepID=A0A0L6UCJ7_9BASI|nr:putative signal peptide protein [Puccinia sorghi]
MDGLVLTFVTVCWMVVSPESEFLRQFDMLLNVFVILVAVFSFLVVSDRKKLRRCSPRKHSERRPLQPVKNIIKQESCMGMKPSGENYPTHQPPGICLEKTTLQGSLASSIMSVQNQADVLKLGLNQPKWTSWARSHQHFLDTISHKKKNVLVSTTESTCKRIQYAINHIPNPSKQAGLSLSTRRVTPTLSNSSFDWKSETCTLSSCTYFMNPSYTRQLIFIVTFVLVQRVSHLENKKQDLYDLKSSKSADFFCEAESDFVILESTIIFSLGFQNNSCFTLLVIFSFRSVCETLVFPIDKVRRLIPQYWKMCTKYTLYSPKSGVPSLDQQAKNRLLLAINELPDNGHESLEVILKFNKGKKASLLNYKIRMVPLLTLNIVRPSLDPTGFSALVRALKLPKGAHFNPLGQFKVYQVNPLNWDFRTISFFMPNLHDHNVVLMPRSWKFYVINICNFSYLLGNTKGLNSNLIELRYCEIQQQLHNLKLIYNINFLVADKVIISYVYETWEILQILIAIKVKKTEEQLAGTLNILNLYFDKTESSPSDKKVGSISRPETATFHDLEVFQETKWGNLVYFTILTSNDALMATELNQFSSLISPPHFTCHQVLIDWSWCLYHNSSFQYCNLFYLPMTSCCIVITNYIMCQLFNRMNWNQFSKNIKYHNYIYVIAHRLSWGTELSGEVAHNCYGGKLRFTKVPEYLSELWIIPIYGSISILNPSEILKIIKRDDNIDAAFSKSYIQKYSTKKIKKWLEYDCRYIFFCLKNSNHYCGIFGIGYLVVKLLFLTTFQRSYQNFHDYLIHMFLNFMVVFHPKASQKKISFRIQKTRFFFLIYNPVNILMFNLKRPPLDAENMWCFPGYLGMNIALLKMEQNSLGKKKRLFLLGKHIEKLTEKRKEKLWEEEISRMSSYKKQVEIEGKTLQVLWLIKSIPQKIKNIYCALVTCLNFPNLSEPIPSMISIDFTFHFLLFILCSIPAYHLLEPLQFMRNNATRFSKKKKIFSVALVEPPKVKIMLTIYQVDYAVAVLVIDVSATVTSILNFRMFILETEIFFSINLTNTKPTSQKTRQSNQKKKKHVHIFFFQLYFYVIFIYINIFHFHFHFHFHFIFIFIIIIIFFFFTCTVVERLYL